MSEFVEKDHGQTLESTLKAGINTKLPTSHDKAFFTDDDGEYIIETQVAYGGQEVGRRKGAEEVAAIWACSVALVWFV
jgi:hypothetical protein